MYMFKIYDTKLKKYVYFNLDDEVKYESINYRMQELNSDLTKCKDEKLKLQAVVADLTQVNRRWQRYNNDMQVYIKKLQATIEEQQEQINNIADFKAEQLLSCNKQGSEREVACWHCQPTINNLKCRISSLESEIKNNLRENRKSDFESEVLSLQIRLRQACDHIDHLNRLMVNKGILKSGYNVLPETNKHKVAMPCSLADLKFYECDSGTFKDNSDVDITSKGISRDIKAESIINENLSIASESIDKSHKNEDLTKPSGSHNYKYSDNSVNCIKTENNFSDNLKTTDFNIPHCSKTDNLTKTGKNEELIIDFNSVIKEPPDRNTKLIHNNCKVWNISDILREGVDKELLGTPMHITCPHCSTIFPPNSDDSFSRHITSCQLL